MGLILRSILFKKEKLMNYLGEAFGTTSGGGGGGGGGGGSNRAYSTITFACVLDDPTNNSHLNIDGTVFSEPLQSSGRANVFIPAFNGKIIGVSWIKSNNNGVVMEIRFNGISGDEHLFTAAPLFGQRTLDIPFDTSHYLNLVYRNSSGFPPGNCRFFLLVEYDLTSTFTAPLPATFMSLTESPPAFIELDGVNDYIQFTGLTNGSENVLDWTKDWSLGVSLHGLGSEGSSDSKYVTLASNGTNAMYLRRGGTNWGFYVGSGTVNAGANTWVAPTSNSRLLFTYSATDKRLKYFLGDPTTGSFNQRANYLVSSAQLAANAPSGTLYLGKSIQTGTHYTAVNWDGGVNNLILSNTQLRGPQLTDYFLPGEDFPSREFYPDLTTWAKLGEAVYPTVTDEKGNANGGILVNGASNDFVPQNDN